MSKKAVLWTVAGLALVASTTMAGSPVVTYDHPALGALAEGEIYLNTDPRPTTEFAAPLPTTTGPGNSKSGSKMDSKPGPTSLDSGDLSRGGGAIVGPGGGGSIYSPRQQADREVSRLIRKLG